jgi:hypothetical protein
VQVACLDMSYILVEVMHASASVLQMLISLKGGDNATQAQIDLTTKTMTNAEELFPVSLIMC